MQKNTTTFFNEIERFYKSKKPFVVYRKPDENRINAYIQKTDTLFELQSFSESGFIFAPFANSEKSVIFPFKKCVFISTKINSEEELKTNLEEKILVQNKVEVIQFKNNSTLKQNHIKLIQNGIAFIETGKAKKIVLSRKEDVKYENLDIINTLKKMLYKYSNAFVYLWYHPKVGVWMGATPERLLHVKNNYITTMALAATQIYKGTTDVIWQKKEIQEQQYVTSFILEVLKKEVKNSKISKPYTVKAGNLLHIRTDISGELKHKYSIKKLINLLHPTPAVCGIPKSIAANFILQNEGYNRAYYSGYLGELNINNSTNLVVNLRCMQLKNNTVSIYVGGGITTESNPLKEWEETVSKAKVIKSIL